jgi:cystathionine beta-synthase
MVRLNAVTAGLACEVVAKCEFMNPGGSVKDRIGVRMLLDAEKSGPHQAGRHPDRTDLGQHRHRPRAGRRGARLPDHHHDAGEDVAARSRWCSRRSAPRSSAPRPRRRGTRPRATSAWPSGCARSSPTRTSSISTATRPTRWPTRRAPAARSCEQTDGRLDAVVMTAGTGGTLTGVARASRSACRTCRSSASIRRARSSPDPARSRATRSRASATTSSPTCSTRSLVDRWIKSNDKDSFRIARQLIRQEGLLVGGSSGSAVWAALQVAKELPEGRRQAGGRAPADSIRNYLTKFVDDRWMRENGFLKADWAVGTIATWCARSPARGHHRRPPTPSSARR